jgi:hypothetical protein
VQQQRVQQRQLAWHQQRELQVRLAQQLVQEQQRVQESLFYRKRPKQQQRSRQPKRGTCS